MISSIKISNRELITHYSESVITKTISNSKQLTVKVYVDDVLKNQLKVKTLNSMLYHIGITVNNQGTVLFVQDWDTGVYAYDIISGQLLWHNKTKCVHQIMCCNDKVFCFIMNRRMVILKADSGETVFVDKSFNSEYYFELPFHRIFFGPKQRKWHMVDLETLKVQCSFPEKLINPNAFTTCVVCSVIQDGNVLNLRGFEGDGSFDNKNFERTLHLEDGIV